MNYLYIKNGIIVSIAMASIFLIIGAIQFSFYDEFSSYLSKLISMSIAFIVILVSHIWSSKYEEVNGLQKILLLSLYIEIVFSLLFTVILIFGLLDILKTIVLLVSFQLVHGAVYVVNMYIFDERVVSYSSQSEQEILAKSKKANLDAALQE